MRQCRGVTKDNRRCLIEVEPWRQQDLCHVHDPDGRFRKQHPYGQNKSKTKKKNIKGKLKQDIIVQMLSRKCTTDPFREQCLSEDAMHCDTIDYMIEIVAKA